MLSAVHVLAELLRVSPSIAPHLELSSLAARTACGLRMAAARTDEVHNLKTAEPLLAACRAVRSLLSRHPRSCGPLMQHGHDAEWAPVAAAVAAALPPQLRRRAQPALAGVTQALRETTPEGQAAARQAAAAAAAADAAMRELVLEVTAAPGRRTAMWPSRTQTRTLRCA